MKKIILILSVAIVTPAQAEIFKCSGTEQKTLYQSDPCPAGAVHQQIVEIERPDPAKAAEAEARLKAWQADLAVKDAEEHKAQKERQEISDRRATIDALNRSAAAQQELAEAAKRPVIINQPLLVNPYIGNPRRWPSTPPSSQVDHQTGNREPSENKQSYPLRGIKPN